MDVGLEDRKDFKDPIMGLGSTNAYFNRAVDDGYLYTVGARLYRHEMHTMGVKSFVHLENRLALNRLTFRTLFHRAVILPQYSQDLDLLGILIWSITNWYDQVVSLVG